MGVEDEQGRGEEAHLADESNSELIASGEKVAYADSFSTQNFNKTTQTMNLCFAR